MIMYSGFHKSGLQPGLVVCSGRADKPRFIIVPSTLMTPGPSPPRIVGEYPSPQMRMTGALPWRLESAGASRMASGQSTRLRMRRALKSSAAAKLEHTQKMPRSLGCVKFGLLLPCVTGYSTALLQLGDSHGLWSSLRYRFTPG